MTRVESNLPQFGPEGSDLKELVKQEAKKLRPEKKVVKKRSFFSCFNCLILLLLVLAVLAGWLAFLVAKSGLVEIPIFSQLFYQTPQPIHWVKTDQLPTTDLEKELAEKFQPGQKRLIIEWNEVEMTQMLNENLEQINSTPDKLLIKETQIAIDSEQIEFFSQLEEPIAGYLTVSTVPRVEDQQLKFVVQEVKIGNLKLPPALAAWGIDKMINSRLSEVFAELPVIVKRVDLKMGRALV